MELIIIGRVVLAVWATALSLHYAVVAIEAARDAAVMWNASRGDNDGEDR